MKSKLITIAYISMVGGIFLFQSCNKPTVNPNPAGDNPPTWSGDSTSVDNDSDSTDFGGSGNGDSDTTVFGGSGNGDSDTTGFGGSGNGDSDTTGTGGSGNGDSDSTDFGG